MKEIKVFFKEETAIGVVEIILILVILIALVLLFKGKISSVVNNGVKVAPVRYNLSGQRVDDQYKGIVIVNGKKQLLK